MQDAVRGRQAGTSFRLHNLLLSWPLGLDLQPHASSICTETAVEMVRIWIFLQAE